MRSAYWIVIIGFVLGGVGLLVGVFLERSIGIRLFFIGFVAAFVGMTWSNMAMKFPEAIRRRGYGLRIGTVGFLVATAGMVLQEYLGDGTVVVMFAVIGFALMIWGIVLMMGNSNNN